jgi:ribosomal protein L40E
MPSNRPNPTLDEQSFEGLLSAAFTIQEHNDRLKQTQPAAAEPEPDNICPHCGAAKPAVGSRCASCGLDELRPGERLQRNWASMWLMSQEQRLWPERSPGIREGRREGVAPLHPEPKPQAQPALDFAAPGIFALPVTKEVAQAPIAQDEIPTIQRALGKSGLRKETTEGPWVRNVTREAITEETADFPQKDLAPEELTQEDVQQQEDLDLAVQAFQFSATDDSYLTDASISVDDDAPRSLIQRFADWHLKLRFQRADLYLGVAVFVAAIALLWPAAGPPQRAALGPWERALVTLGIAEAPAPVVHVRGDPGITVWVDPHSALYYCPGEEQYGKTADGRFSSQRDAQMDRFEPAARSACE